MEPEQRCPTCGLSCFHALLIERIYQRIQAVCLRQVVRAVAEFRCESTLEDVHAQLQQKAFVLPSCIVTLVPDAQKGAEVNKSGLCGW